MDGTLCIPSTQSTCFRFWYSLGKKNAVTSLANILALVPIGSMYGIFTYIYHKYPPNVGK